MLIIIDSNEYIFAFGPSKESNALHLEIVFQYEAKGLKPADAFIAAYTEWAGADCLVTENRHFLFRHADLPFKVLTAEKCLKLI
ncbi:MAG: hypothetical protein KKH11_04200 [Candidatus Omnitrophica bacterium]|nr:hypothetical protein [Candidatus Omnitrophota bacterium]